MTSASSEAPAEAPPASDEGDGGGPGPIRQAWQDVNRSGPSWGQAVSNPFRPRAGDTGGFIGGLALYMIAVIYIRYGPEGWKGWLSAKFLNKPLTTADGAGGPPKKPGGGKRLV